MSDASEFTGKRILVTGGSKGIGEAIVRRLRDGGVTIHRPPRDGHMAFVKTPDGISVELLQDGSLPPQEPWASMPNTGSW